MKLKRRCLYCKTVWNTTSMIKTFICSPCQHQRANPRDKQVKGPAWAGWIRQRKLTELRP